MTQIKGVIANVDSATEHWTDEAIASLVGQTPRFTIEGDMTRPVAKAEVVAAERRDNDVVVTFEVPDERAGRVKDLLGPSADGEPHIGIGYYVPRAETGEDGITSLIREFRLMTVSRAAYRPGNAPFDPLRERAQVIRGRFDV